MLELLNNVTHKNLRVVTRRGARWGDDVMSCPVTIDEFRSLQANYPILLQQDSQGSFQPLVLFGLQDGQNLFLDGDRWDADYLPLAMQRMPFSIGIAQDELRMMVDMASPRIGQGGDGESVFLEHGGNTPFLDQANSVLRTLHEGLQSTADFVQALVSNRLLEPFVFEVEQPDGSRGQLVGCHLIHEERLAALDASTVAMLHEADYLQPIYMAIASLSNLSRLATRHRTRKVGGTAKA